MKRSTVLIGCSAVAATLAATFQFAGGLGGDAPAAGDSDVVSTVAESSIAPATSTGTGSGTPIATSTSVAASSGAASSDAGSSSTAPSTVPASGGASSSTVLIPRPPPTRPSTTSTSASTTSNSSISASPVDDPLRDVLAELGGLVVVADPDPSRPPYDRDTYQPGGWADLDGDCISGRHEVLTTQSEVPVRMDPSGCFVDTGRWTDPYTGTVVRAASDITIDHVVPLSEAHRAGAWRWDVATRIAFAHDETLGHLVPVVGSVNQSKGDKTPDEWLPPRRESHCTYAANWVSIKVRWRLTVTRPEATALTRILSTCAAGDIPDRPLTPPPAIVLAPPVAPVTIGSVPPAGAGQGAGNGSGELQVAECQRREERVVLVNPTMNAISLADHRLHDEESRHSTALDQFGSIAAGGRLVILTGEDAVASPGEVIWKRQNVWNNDGDTAHLVTPSGSVTTARC